MAFIRTSKQKAAKNRRKAAAYKRVCSVVDARDGGFCRVCLHCYRDINIHHHHIVFRSQGGKDTTSNIATVCAGCHADIHERRIAVSGDANGPLTIRRTHDATRERAL